MIFAPAIATVSPLLNPSLIATIASAVIAVFAGGGYWAYRVAKRKEPLDTRTVDAATTEQLGNLALSIANAADKRSQGFEARLDALSQELREQRRHSHAQDERIHQLTLGLRTLQAWGQAIIDDWPHLRLREEPPQMPAIDIHVNKEN